MSGHNWACVCRGAGTVEDGPAGATYSVPCPGPPPTITQFGVTYVRTAEVERLREQRDAVASKAVEFMDEARQILRALDDGEAAAHLLDVGISRVRALLDGET